ncbi:MAG TPA: orotate phosphoribosyltransferase [Acidobacteriota bacterium]|jgi:orotate phosphoribosyltransferase|nr:orotate phosphoribosyltransferase [Acidobacteriota bacterium]
MDILHLFREKGALLEGHFQLSSGLHSPNYLQCALVLQFPDLAAKLGSELAQKIRKEIQPPSFVISPALGGLIIGYEVGRALAVRFLFAERVRKSFGLRRGFQIRAGESCIVVEDVITTGGSTQEVLDLITSKGAIPSAVGCVVDRSGGKASFQFRNQPLPLISLARLDIPTHAPESCPLCKTGSAAVKPGSRPT